jgi:hypothetical protein
MDFARIVQEVSRDFAIFLYVPNFIPSAVMTEQNFVNCVVAAVHLNRWALAFE